MVSPESIAPISKPGASLGKRLIVGLAGLLFVLVAAAVVLPFVIDVDQYRPEIVRAANERIRGKLELGKLKLTLWGRIRVEVAGLKIFDTAGKELVGVDDAHLHIPLSSLWSGEPTLTFRMEEPRVSVIKSAAGEVNFLKLVPEALPPSEGSPPVAGA
ncbi:MAG: hypothetical protein IT285_09570, partial [Bdellovibrionales bacterium]|nr:hypothetical protein [Bdellovibrionales bacterium]